MDRLPRQIPRQGKEGRRKDANMAANLPKDGAKRTRSSSKQQPGTPLTPPATGPASPQFPGFIELTRSHSHRDAYDAETGALDSEFALHSQDHGSVASTSAPPPLGSRRTASSTGRIAGQETWAEYGQRDAKEELQEAAELERVRSGASGRSARPKSSADVDLEKGAATSQEEETENSTVTSAEQDGTTGKDADKGEEKEKEEEDPNLVTWDSPTSPENPRNWSSVHKTTVVVIVSSYTLLSPLSSSVIAPALPLLSEQFGLTSSVRESMMLSIFVLAYAIGPLLLAPLSEMYGRRIVLQFSNVFFIIFSLACGFAKTSTQLTAFRFFCGFGGSAPLVCGGGVIADLFSPDNRGAAMAAYSLAPLLGPCIGPIVGGWIVQSLDGPDRWRWIFWAVTIFSAVVASIGLIILPETYQPRILELKCNALKKKTGNEKLHTIFQTTANETTVQRFKRNIFRPFILLTTQPIVIALSILMSTIYGSMYIVLTTFSRIFTEYYGESIGISSLNYISLAIGFTIGGQVGGRAVDKIYRRLKERNGGVGRPEFKLPLMMVGTPIFVAGTLIYGWTAQERVHWIAPNIGALIFAIGLMTIFLSIQNMLVDSYGLIAASAISAATFLRSLAGFGFPLFATAMYDAITLGGGNSLLAGVVAIVGIPAPFLLWKYGPYLRSKSSYAVQPPSTPSSA